MRETVLLYNFTDKERLNRVRQALLPLGFRLRAVDRRDYLKPVGALAGALEAETGETPEYDGPGFDSEMALLAGLTSVRIDLFIKALRRTGVGKIDYKAVLTDANKSWDSLKLYQEIKEEHEAMNQSAEEE